MIEQVISCTPNFTREIFFARLQTSEMWIKQNRELPRVESSFSIQRDRPTLTRSATTIGDYASSSRA